jgi:hypothetical protein
MTKTTAQELQVRRNAAGHLSGVPARQNANRIEMLETWLVLERLEAEFGAEEIARWERMEECAAL